MIRQRPPASERAADRQRRAQVQAAAEQRRRQTRDLLQRYTDSQLHLIANKHVDQLLDSPDPAQAKRGNALWFAFKLGELRTNLLWADEWPKLLDTNQTRPFTGAQPRKDQ